MSPCCFPRFGYRFCQYPLQQIHIEKPCPKETSASAHVSLRKPAKKNPGTKRLFKLMFQVLRRSLNWSPR